MGSAQIHSCVDGFDCCRSTTYLGNNNKVGVQSKYYLTYYIGKYFRKGNEGKRSNKYYLLYPISERDRSNFQNISKLSWALPFSYWLHRTAEGGGVGRVSEVINSQSEALVRGKRKAYLEECILFYPVHSGSFGAS